MTKVGITTSLVIYCAIVAVVSYVHRVDKQGGRKHVSKPKPEHMVPPQIMTIFPSVIVLHRNSALKHLFNRSVSLWPHVNMCGVYQPLCRLLPDSFIHRCSILD